MTTESVVFFLKRSSKLAQTRPKIFSTMSCSGHPHCYSWPISWQIEFPLSRHSILFGCGQTKSPPQGKAAGTRHGTLVVTCPIGFHSSRRCQRDHNSLNIRRRRKGATGSHIMIRCISVQCQCGLHLTWQRVVLPALHGFVVTVFVGICTLGWDLQYHFPPSPRFACSRQSASASSCCR
jgi:hypothetical protein